MKIITQEISHSLLKDKEIQLFIKRIDLIHPFVSGNKYYKLKYNLIESGKQNTDTILTFGGAYSNHIVATAFAANKKGFKSVGIIRGEETLPLNDTLSFAKENSMELHYVSREEYRQKHTEGFMEKLKDKFGDHGFTALAMAKKVNSKTWIIDNFLLSCRILGRGVENVLLYELLKKLKKKKVNIVKGNYIKTKKNQQCKDFFIKNNFIKKDKAYICELNKLKKLNNNFLKIKYE